MYTERPERLLGAGSVSERGVDKPVGEVSLLMDAILSMDTAIPMETSSFHLQTVGVGKNR